MTNFYHCLQIVFASAIFICSFLYLSLNIYDYFVPNSMPINWYRPNNWGVVGKNKISKIDTNKISENDLEFDLYEKMKVNKNRLKKLPWPYFSTQTFMLGVADHIKVQYKVRDARTQNLTIRNDDFNPKNVKHGQIIFIKTEYINDFFRSYHPKINGSYLLLSMLSDLNAGSTEQLKFLNHSKIIAWYALNAIGRHPKFFHLPYGIPDFRSEYEGNIGDPRIVRNISRKLIPFNKRKNLLYLNFRPSSNEEERVPVYKYFKENFLNDSRVHFKWALLEPPYQQRPQPDYRETLIEMGNTQFVVSPIGAGIDCYRTWEALIMGSVPIVTHSEIDPLFDGMPIMVVNSFSEVTVRKLEEFKSKLNLSADGIPWRPKIWLRYWIDRFQNDIRQFNK